MLGYPYSTEIVVNEKGAKESRKYVPDDADCPGKRRRSISKKTVFIYGLHNPPVPKRIECMGHSPEPHFCRLDRLFAL